MHRPDEPIEWRLRRAYEGMQKFNIKLNIDRISIFTFLSDQITIRHQYFTFQSYGNELLIFRQLNNHVFLYIGCQNYSPDEYSFCFQAAAVAQEVSNNLNSYIFQLDYPLPAADQFLSGDFHLNVLYYQARYTQRKYPAESLLHAVFFFQTVHYLYTQSISMVQKRESCLHQLSYLSKKHDH